MAERLKKYLKRTEELVEYLTRLRAGQRRRRTPKNGEMPETERCSGRVLPKRSPSFWFKSAFFSMNG